MRANLVARVRLLLQFTASLIGQIVSLASALPFGFSLANELQVEGGPEVEGATGLVPVLRENNHGNEWSWQRVKHMRWLPGRA